MRVHVFLDKYYKTVEITHKEARHLIGEEAFKKHMEIFKQGRENGDFVEYPIFEHGFVLYMWE